MMDHLVGVRIIAPIWLRLSSVSLRRIISTTGTTNASVFPEPVTASTQTSLFVRKSGIVAAYEYGHRRTRRQKRVGGRGGGTDESERKENDQIFHRLTPHFLCQPHQTDTGRYQFCFLLHPVSSVHAICSDNFKVPISRVIWAQVGGKCLQE